MLDGNSAHYEQVQDDAEVRSENIDVRSILTESSLPEGVRNAKIHYQVERRMDADLLAFLTSDDRSQSGDDTQTARLERRRKALSKHLDAFLICLTIRMPGVLYTVEINANTRSIAHWEWQEV